MEQMPFSSREAGLAFSSNAASLHKAPQLHAHKDGQTRWSVGPIYSIHNRKLLSNFTIREHLAVVRPAQPIDFRELPSPPLRPRLGLDARAWMGGSWQGVMQEAIFDEDGNMFRVKARPTTWVPPDESYPDYVLVRYPDAVYGYFPTRLPQLIDSDDCNRSNAVRFEVGGFMREVREFRRLILRYSGDGKPASLTMEWYSPTRTRSQRTLSVLRSATGSEGASHFQSGRHSLSSTASATRSSNDSPRSSAELALRDQQQVAG